MGNGEGILFPSSIIIIMYAWIKYKGDLINNYTRFGKVIPKSEKKIDMYKFFGTNSKKRIDDIAESLKSDKKIFFKIHKGG